MKFLRFLLYAPYSPYGRTRRFGEMVRRCAPSFLLLSGITYVLIALIMSIGFCFGLAKLLEESGGSQMLILTFCGGFFMCFLTARVVEKGHEGNLAVIHKKRVESIPPDKIRQWILADEHISESLLQDPLSEGIWHTTGHGYFWNDAWYSSWYVWVFAILCLLLCGIVIGRYFL